MSNPLTPSPATVYPPYPFYYPPCHCQPPPEFPYPTPIPPTSAPSSFYFSWNPFLSQYQFSPIDTSLPSSSPLPSSTKCSSLSTLPDISHIPILKGRDNWTHWFCFVSSMLLYLNIHSHVCDEPAPGTPRTSWNTPSPMPTTEPTDAVSQKAYHHWWDEDLLASFILTSRLSADIVPVLPEPVSLETGNPRTARQIFTALRFHCGIAFSGQFVAVRSSMSLKEY